LVALALGSTGAGPSPITKGPYLQQVGPDGVVVRLEVDPAAPVEVELTTGSDAGAKSTTVVRDVAVTAFHSVRIAGLKPSTRYDYRVSVAGARSPAGTFTTAPAPGDDQPFAFLVYGDDRSGDEAHAAIVRSLIATPADFLIHTGDCVANGGDPEQWQTFFDIEAPLLRDRALFACVGNHELVDHGATAFLRYFGPGDAGEAAPALYWTMRWGDARFFFLNGMDTWSSSDEKGWLRGELAKADAEAGLVWRFVVVHHSPWSTGPHGNNARMLEAGVVPLLVEHKVDMVFAGHDHIFERGEQDGLKYIVSGGGGAPLYKIEHPQASARKAEPAYHFVKVSVTKDSGEVVAVRADGSVLDRCGFKRDGGDWTCDVALRASIPASSPAAEAAPPAAPSSASPKCGCDVPGARAASWPLAAALAWMAALALRRRRG
jgi:predicted phosphodiesterase